MQVLPSMAPKVRVAPSELPVPVAAGRPAHGVLSPPPAGSRRWAADEFGTAADALTLATDRWMDPPYTNEGLLLAKASSKLRGALPQLLALPEAADIIGPIEEAIDGAGQLSQVYMSGRVPDPLDDMPIAQMIQRWALDARTAQTYLAYACGDIIAPR